MTNSIAQKRKKEGFDGQLAIVLPKKIVEASEQLQLIRNLYITDIGFYPKAKFHYRKRPHGISQNILIYCIDGSGFLELSNKRTTVSKGQFIVIPADTPHCYGSDEDNPWTIYWLHFKGALAGQLAGLMTDNGGKIAIDVSFTEDRSKLFSNMYRVLETGYSVNNLTFVNLSCMHFLASFCFPDIFLLPQKQNGTNVIEMSINYMRKHAEEIVTLDELASFSNLSTSHFSAVFKKRTGYPPLEYFNQIKIQKACQYLQFTDLQVKEISYKLGIEDPYYFSRLFTKIIGQSPVEYRKRKK